MKSRAKANGQIIRMGGAALGCPPPLLLWFSWLWPWISVWALRSTPLFSCCFILMFYHVCDLFVLLSLWARKTERTKENGTGRKLDSKTRKKNGKKINRTGRQKRRQKQERNTAIKRKDRNTDRRVSLASGRLGTFSGRKGTRTL